MLYRADRQRAALANLHANQGATRFTFHILVPWGTSKIFERTPWLVYPLLSKMNLALIDPFQLAQDYPDALTNDLREC
jgi:hypothetical protein